MRISRHQAYMDTAEVWAKRSTCMRLNVGAVVVVDKTIVSHGYNGPPAGEEHCTGKSCADPAQGCQRAVHAEINALKRIPWSVATKMKSLYVTASPCAHCMHMIVRDNSIHELYFRELYRINDHLMEAPIDVFRVTPSGYLINFKTGELVDP